MTTLFEQLMDGGATETLKTTFGLAVTYSPKGGTGVSVTAVNWHENDTDREGYDHGENYLRTGIVHLSPEDAPAPSLTDTFTITGHTWAVARLGRRLPFVEFHVERQELSKRGRGHEAR